VVGALLLVGCGSAAAPRPTASPSVAPTPTPSLVDACIVGTWRSTIGMLPEPYQGATVTVVGGGGVVLTYNPNGTYSGDFANAQPYTATTSDGHRIALVATGSVAGTFTTIGGELSLVDSQTILAVTTTIDGHMTSSAAASSTTSAEYTCTVGGPLTLSSGGFSTHYVRRG
jgi:molecular chaperone DnaK